MGHAARTPTTEQSFTVSGRGLIPVLAVILLPDYGTHRGQICIGSLLRISALLTLIAFLANPETRARSGWPNTLYVRFLEQLHHPDRYRAIPVRVILLYGHQA